VSDAPKLVSTAIEHILPWGQTLRGVRWSGSDNVVLLLHEPGADLDAWLALPPALAQTLGVTALAFDLPGHGLSDDPWQPDQLPDVLCSLAGTLPTAGRLVIVAAGQTATAALACAADLPLAGLVCLSLAGAVNTASRSPLVPKLFVAGSLAGDDLDHARLLATGLGGWALVTAVPVNARGTQTLDTEWAGHIAEQITGFLHDCFA
jgi:pimeloyl-ACP methyl ester carboxylesterase